MSWSKITAREPLFLAMMDATIGAFWRMELPLPGQVALVEQRHGAARLREREPQVAVRAADVDYRADRLAAEVRRTGIAEQLENHLQVVAQRVEVVEGIMSSFKKVGSRRTAS